MEILTAWESKNKYDISDNAGTELFKAAEQSDTMDRQCCGAYRAFDMMIEDLQGNVLIQLKPTICLLRSRHVSLLSSGK